VVKQLSSQIVTPQATSVSVASGGVLTSPGILQNVV